MEALAGAPALLSSAGPRGAYAQDSDYREDNNFFYLTGLEVPGGWLFLNGAEDQEAVLYLPPRSRGAEQWTGEQVGPGERAKILSGLAVVKSAEELGDDLRQWMTVAEASGTEERALYTSFGHPAIRDQLAVDLTEEGVELRSLAPHLAQLRLVKDDEELRRLRKAIEITMEAQREVWRLAEPGHYEYELEAALEYVFHASGAERVGFTSIVGSGPNSNILHYDRSRRRTEAGDLVVVDIGAEFGYYTADITRTFPVSGRFTPRQKAIYDLVLEAREAALAVIRPGATMAEVNQAVRTHFQENSGDLCGEATCRPHLLHGVSHWLGMDVHDVGSTRTPFVAGMVITLEPGLYMVDEGFGIRVEDDILITSDGYEVLTEDLPRSTEEIEAIMAMDPEWVRAVGDRPGRSTESRARKPLGSG
jgi:Xaa-Pro aminopeptidase